MLVILEGADGSGKTTLSSKLKDKGYEVIRLSRGNNLSYSCMLKMALEKKVYVFDRMFLSTWVYRILDDEPLDKEDYEWNDMLTLLAISKIIYCKTENDFERSIERGEDNITTKDTAVKLQNIYNFVFDTIKLYNMSTVITYDWTKDKLNKVLRFIGEQ